LNLKIRLDRASIDEAAKKLETAAADLDRKTREICERLATIGAVRASLDYARVPLDGPKDVTVTVEPFGNGYKVIASGETVLFLEFGSGALYGYGHPEPGEYGPGTWPDPHYRRDPANGAIIYHWNDPQGWCIPKEKGGGHTYGNPPAMGMYNASRDIRDNIKRIVEEVLLS